MTPNPNPNPPAAPAIDAVASGAFSAGWLVAQLHEPIAKSGGPSAEHPLPTAKELGRFDRGTLALHELKQLIDVTLAASLTSDAPAITATYAAVDNAWTDNAFNLAAFQQQLEQLHRQILTALTVADHRLGSAYSLGRSLSDTCWRPDTKEEFTAEFNKYRIGTIRGWLSDLPIGLPRAAAVVSQSLGHWSDWLAATEKEPWDATRSEKVKRAAETQGEHWRALLAGEKNPQSLLTPDGYVAAGTAALTRAGKIVRRTVGRFLPAIVLALLVTALGVGIALRYAEGTAQVWAALVSLAAGFGVTGKSIQTTAKNVASDAGRPLLELSEIDAMSWAATELPAVAATPKEQRDLRRRGVEPPSVT